jgi:integrase
VIYQAVSGDDLESPGGRYPAPDDRASGAPPMKVGLADACRTPLAGDYELMACFAAYTGSRWGELAALTTAQVDTVGLRAARSAGRRAVTVRGRSRFWRGSRFAVPAPSSSTSSSSLTPGLRVRVRARLGTAHALRQVLAAPRSDNGHYSERMIKDGAEIVTQILQQSAVAKQFDGTYVARPSLAWLKIMEIRLAHHADLLVLASP